MKLFLNKAVYNIERMMAGVTYYGTPPFLCPEEAKMRGLQWVTPGLLLSAGHNRSLLSELRKHKGSFLRFERNSEKYHPERSCSSSDKR